MRVVGLGIALGGVFATGPAAFGALPAPAADPSGAGLFVIGDGNAAVGQTVEFWGAQWAQNNVLSAGDAPNSFKGFADIVQSPATGACNGTFSTRPGNSSEPPPSVAGEITVLVASSVTKSGDVISGTYSGMVVVSTEPGYASDPGHSGIGVVLRSACTPNTGGGAGGGGSS
jgi:hypothetical protein